MLGDGVGEREEKGIDRFQMSGVQLLKVGEHNFGSGFSCFREAAREEGSLAHLARALDEDNAVLASDRGKKVVICGAHDVEGRIQRDRAADGLQLERTPLLARIPQ